MGPAIRDPQLIQADQTKQSDDLNGRYKQSSLTDCESASSVGEMSWFQTEI